jgi:precorrin-3B synthase
MTKGWCPTLYEPMEAADGYLVRVKPRVTGLSATQARAIAAAARRFGSGQITLTLRANFQIRGLALTAVPHFAEAMRAADLASPTASAERRRNIVMPPSPGDTELALATELESWLEQDESLAALPPKFGFALGDAQADIGILPGDPASLLLPGNFAAASTTPLASAQTLTRLFLQQSPCSPRMAALVTAIGAAAIFQQAGLHPCETPRPALVPATGTGAAHADMLDHAADLAERFGIGQLRTTHTRMLVLPGADGAEFTSAAEAYEFVCSKKALLF